MAQALVKKKNIRPSIILDNNRHVYYTGYGTVDALKLLRENGIKIAGADGIRIDILIADDKALIYSPTPRTVEKLPSGDTPNGILTDASAVKNLVLNIELRSETTQENLTNKMVTDDALAQAAGSLKNNKLIIREIPDQEIEETANAVAKTIPNFNLCEILQVYTSCIQFVEPILTGINNIKKTKITLPSELLHLTTDKEVQENLKTTYSLFANETAIIDLTKDINKRYDDLLKTYTTQLKDFGRIIKKEKIDEFETAVAKLNRHMQNQRDELQKHLASTLEKARTSVCSTLYQTMSEHPTADLKKYLGGSPYDKKIIKEYVDKRVQDAFARHENITEKIGLKFMYKDVTIKMLESEDFNNEIKKHEDLYFFIEGQGGPVDKHLAAKEVRPGEENTLF